MEKYLIKNQEQLDRTLGWYDETDRPKLAPKEFPLLLVSVTHHVSNGRDYDQIEYIYPSDFNDQLD